MKTEFRNKMWGLVAVTAVGLLTVGSTFAGPVMPVQPRLRPQVPPPVVNTQTPRLGIMGHIRQHWGMVVDSVNRGTTASRMGLEPGDVIVRINNRQINSDRSYQESLWHAVRFQNGFVDAVVVDVRTGRTVHRTGHLYTGASHSQPRFAPQFSPVSTSY